jgi:hypothetical protein
VVWKMSPLMTGAALVAVLALPSVGVAHDDPQQVTPGPAVPNDPSSTPQFGSTSSGEAPATAAAPAPPAEAQPQQQQAPARTAVQPATITRSGQTTAARPVVRVTSRPSTPRATRSTPAPVKVPLRRTVAPRARTTGSAPPQSGTSAAGRLSRSSQSRDASGNASATRRSGSALRVSSTTHASQPTPRGALSARDASSDALSSPRASGGAQISETGIAAGLFALSLGGCCLVLRRRRRPHSAASAHAGVDEVEAALQELLAEEHARERTPTGARL